MILSIVGGNRKAINFLFCVICLNTTGCTAVVEDEYTGKDLFSDSVSALPPITNVDDTVPLILKEPKELKAYLPGSSVRTKNVSRRSLVAFAQTLTGTPYKYGSTDPKVGFDCSGFISYVFNHFDIAVPRSSIDFTNVGEQIYKAEARPGDLILFTGTDSLNRRVGHMGIITYNTPDTLLFIHSTSGKMKCVTETSLNNHYQSRFVKIIRVFKK